jgi:hypothetical protein
LARKLLLAIEVVERGVYNACGITKNLRKL